MPGETGVARRRFREHSHGLVDAPVVEPEIDAQGCCLEVGVGQWLEGVLDPALHFGRVHE